MRYRKKDTPQDREGIWSYYTVYCTDDCVLTILTQKIHLFIFCLSSKNNCMKILNFQLTLVQLLKGILWTNFQVYVKKCHFYITIDLFHWKMWVLLMSAPILYVPTSSTFRHPFFNSTYCKTVIVMPVNVKELIDNFSVIGWPFFYPNFVRKLNFVLSVWNADFHDFVHFSSETN